MSKSNQLLDSVSFDTFKAFYSNVSYKELYSLDTSEFFNQVMIRQRYFTMASYEYSDKNKSIFYPLFELMLNGQVVLDENIFEKYTPKHIKINNPNPPRGIKELSFEKSISISSNILALVDTGFLTFKEQPKDKNHSEYLPYSPKQQAMIENAHNTNFTGQSYENVITEKSYDNKSQLSHILLEVDVKTPEEELLKSFKEIIRARKKTSVIIKNPTSKVHNLITKCQRYRVIEAFDIMTLSSILRVTITQKKLALFLYNDLEGAWNDNEYRKYTLEHWNKIFDPSFYIQYLK